MSALLPFRRFAKGLRENYARVTLPWGQGPIEGQINRLKMLKRQMFGRAGSICWPDASSWQPDLRLDIDQCGVTGQGILVITDRAGSRT